MRGTFFTIALGGVGKVVMYASVISQLPCLYFIIAVWNGDREPTLPAGLN